MELFHSGWGKPFHLTQHIIFPSCLWLSATVNMSSKHFKGLSFSEFYLRSDLDDI